MGKQLKNSARFRLAEFLLGWFPVPQTRAFRKSKVGIFGMA